MADTKHSNNLWQDEFFDILKVLEFGIAKHGHSNWLEPDGKKSSFKEMHESMGRHWAESQVQGYGNGGRGDKETGLDPLLHLAARSLMMYTRIKKGIVHPTDNC